jgi:hypothetical protein
LLDPLHDRRCGLRAATASLAGVQLESRTSSWRTGLALAWVATGAPVVLAALALAPAHSAWWAIGLYHAGCCLAAVAAPAPHGPRPPWTRLAILATATAALVGVTAAAALRLWDFTPAFVRWQSWGLAAPADLAWLAWYVAANPWIEERFWRGTLLGPDVCARIGARNARALAVVGFLAHHIVALVASFGVARGLALCVPILGASAVWTRLRLQSGGIWSPAASHAGADLALALVYLGGVRS